MATAARSRYTPKARNDAYTGLLFISFLALVASCVFLYLDYSQYGNAPPPSFKPAAATSTNVALPSASAPSAPAPAPTAPPMGGAVPMGGNTPMGAAPMGNPTPGPASPMGGNAAAPGGLKPLPTPGSPGK